MPITDNSQHSIPASTYEGYSGSYHRGQSAVLCASIKTRNIYKFIYRTNSRNSLRISCENTTRTAKCRSGLLKHWHRRVFCWTAPRLDWNPRIRPLLTRTSDPSQSIPARPPRNIFSDLSRSFMPSINTTRQR